MSDLKLEGNNVLRARGTVNPQDVRVCVIAGGWSDEREISYDSGKACAEALTTAGFNVEVLDPADPQFFTTFPTQAFDVAFVVLHGRYGEDGCIQGYLELLGIPYTFSDVFAQASAMEKDKTKELIATVGVPAPKGIALRNIEKPDATLAKEIVEELGLPLIVKPIANGSSYGVSKVSDVDMLPQAIEAALICSQGALVEECIQGTEITVPVIGNDDPTTLPIVEIVTGAEFYDSQVKYEPSELHHIIPARLDTKVYQQAEEYAVRAHRALGCAGCSRSDFIIDETGVPYLLEVNTIPGMTNTSLLPDSARRAGLEFPELCTIFVELALEAHAQRNAARTGSVTA